MARGQRQLLNARVRARLGTNTKRQNSQRAARRQHANAMVCFITNNAGRTNPNTAIQNASLRLTRIHCELGRRPNGLLLFGHNLATP